MHAGKHAALIVGVSVAITALGNVWMASPAAIAAQRIRGPMASPLLVHLKWPIAGQVLTSGDEIKIQWDVQVPKGQDLTWCEQEIYLMDVDTKSSIRLTRELGGSVRQFLWTVPSVKTQNAVLDIRFGCQGGGGVFEASNPQLDSPLTIVGSAGGENITLKPVASDAVPGDTVVVDWDSTVSNVESFVVRVSYDRGAHFQTVGETDDLSYEWKIPDDVSGDVTFQIVANRTNGAPVESLMSEKRLKLSPRK